MQALVGALFKFISEWREHSKLLTKVPIIENDLYSAAIFYIMTHEKLSSQITVDTYNF